MYFDPVELNIQETSDEWPILVPKLFENVENIAKKKRRKYVTFLMQF